MPVTHKARAKVRRAIVRPSIVSPEWYRDNVVEVRQSLRQSIRAVKAALTAFAGTGIDSYSRERFEFSPGPIARWRSEHARDLNRQKRRHENELAALEELYPSPAFWKPRAATPADRKIAKQYHAKHTPRNFRFFRSRDAQDYADKRDELNRRHVTRHERWSVKSINVEMTPAYAAEREQWRAELAAGDAARDAAEAERLDLSTEINARSEAA